MILTKRHFETIKNYDFTWTDIQKPTRDNISTLGSQELNLDDFLSSLEALVSGLFHRLSKIEGNLQDLEDEIFDEQPKSTKAKEINLLRREIASLRRIAMPLRSRIYEITNEIQKFSFKIQLSFKRTLFRIIMT